MVASRIAASLVIVCGLATAAQRLLDVPFIRQEREGCGSAAASMVMRYWMAQGAQVDEQAADPAVIQRLLHTPDAQGIYGSALRDYFERHKFSAFVINATPEDLENHLSRGRPVIVCLQPRERAPLHYVVVVGVDSGKDEVVIHDPAVGPAMRHKTASFRKLWNRKGNWTLLAVPQALR